VDRREWIAVARLGRTWGRRGELLGEIYSSKPARAESLGEVLLEAGGRRRRATVERVWRHGGVPVFKFAGIDSISEAQAWEGADVLVAPAERVALEEGEYSHADLAGCRVEWQGRTLGVVEAVEEYGGPAVLRVAREGGGELLIPFARAICTHIDVAAKRIRVEPPEGLLDLP
jgi:16S rRNA processing protein RimM